MIKAAIKSPLGHMSGVVLGISRGNWDKLLAGQPIQVNLRELHPEFPDITVLLLGGETEDDLMEDLRVMGPMRPNPHNTEQEATDG